MLTLIVFILIMSVLVLVHELGHFFAAKKMGVKVEEFGLGLPPTVIKKRFGETEYSLNLLPFGGFVRLAGEEVESGDEVTAAEKDNTNFISKTPLQKAIILAAGVFMNVLLAFALYYVFFFINGFRTQSLPLLFDYEFRFGRSETVNTVIMSFDEDSPAEQVGIEVGEAVIEVDKRPVYSATDVRREVASRVNQETTLLLIDVREQAPNNLRTVTVVPKEGPDGQGILGVYLSKSVVLNYNQGVNRLLAGPLHSYNMLAYSRHVFAQLINISFSSGSAQPISEGVAGPVGIYSVIGGLIDYGGKAAVLSLIDFVALMSLSLAFLNIMPFPALDGGRLVFVAFEGITKKRLNLHIESLIHKWGMAILLGLIVLVTLKDIGRIFG